MAQVALKRDSRSGDRGTKPSPFFESGDRNPVGSQKARSPSNAHTNPGQQGGRTGGHCAPFGVQVAKTVIAFEVPVIEAVTVSLAVMVWLPRVFSVAKRFPTPFVSFELAGSTARVSVLVKCAIPA